MGSPPPGQSCQEMLCQALVAPSILLSASVFGISISISILNPPASSRGSRYGLHCRHTSSQAPLQDSDRSHSVHLQGRCAPPPGRHEGRKPKLAYLSRFWHRRTYRHRHRLPTDSCASLSIPGLQILLQILRQIMDFDIEFNCCLKTMFDKSIYASVALATQGMHSQTQYGGVI